MTVNQKHRGHQKDKNRNRTEDQGVLPKLRFLLGDSSHPQTCQVRERIRELEFQSEKLLGIKEGLKSALGRHVNFFKFSPVGFLTLDRGRIIRQANNYTVNLLGGKPARLTGRHFYSFLLMEKYAEFDSLLERVLKYQTQEFGETVLESQDGRTLDVRFKIGFFPSDQRFYLIFDDNSAHKRSRENWLAVHQELGTCIVERNAELAEANRRLREESAIKEKLIDELKREISFRAGMIARAAEGICVFHETPEFPFIVFTVWNERMKEITGYTMEEINQFGYFEKMFGDNVGKQMALERMKKLRQGKDLLADEREIVHSNGERRIQLVSTTEVDCLDDKRHYLAMIADITDSKRSQEAIEHNALLKMEAEKLAMTNRLTVQIAHEINNPLAGIRNAFLLFKDAIPKDTPEFCLIERAKKEIDRVSRIVRQMFDLHRPNREPKTEVRIGRTIDDIAQMLEPLCTRRGVRIDFEESSFEIDAHLAEGALRQVLYNLMSNAIEASPKEESVKVEMKREENSLVVNVIDKGHGIPPESHNRIFEPFFSTKEAKGSEGGLGLGLSAVKQLMEVLEGTLSFESEVGVGTEFRLQIPLAENEQNRNESNA